VTTHDEETGTKGEPLGMRPKSPPAPGAALSPHKPGMVPDRSTVPGHFGTQVAKAISKQRPLTQYGTAEEIMQVFKRLPEDQIVSANFEQADESFEEKRKASLATVPPVRPKPPAMKEGEVPAALAEKNTEF